MISKIEDIPIFLLCIWAHNQQCKQKNKFIILLTSLDEIVYVIASKTWTNI